MSAGRRARLLAVLGAVVLASLWGGPAGADDITGTVERIGWWSSRLGAQPSVEPVRFEVSMGTDGEPTSVAALDIAVPVGPVQTLQISMTEVAGTANGVGHLRLCLAAPGWQTANAGDLDDAPAFDCSNPADLTRSLEGNWLGDISGLVPNGGTASIGVRLVNDLGLPITLAATVQISDVIIAGESADGPSPTDTTPTTFAPPADDFLEPSEGFVPPPAGAFDAPPLVEPTGDDAPATTTTTAPPPPPLLPAALDSETHSFWTLGNLVRMLVLVPISLGAGFGAVFARRRLEAAGISLS
jgi:hypothetical protein